MFSHHNKYAAKIVAPNQYRFISAEDIRHERRELAKMALAAAVVALGMIIGGWNILG